VASLSEPRCQDIFRELRALHATVTSRGPTPRGRQTRKWCASFMIPEQLTIKSLSEAMIDHRSPPEMKIALFRSLFRGRSDVYPRRFESRRTGKSGYQPACANEWLQGVCEKPRVKCSDCPHQRFVPITDEAIRWHLSGQDTEGKDFVMGIYPMLQDETCFLLAVDFDKEGWREDAKAFWETCRNLKIPAALERSRSGNGGHVWIFFDQAIPATLARKLAPIS